MGRMDERKRERRNSSKKGKKRLTNNIDRQEKENRQIK